MVDNILIKQQLIPIGVSARHVHLSQEHLYQLFGDGKQLTHDFPLSQPGQYAAKERVTIVGRRGLFENVRVLGPVRKESQVEISKTDAIKLGVNPPLRLSGDTNNSEEITIIGPVGEVKLKEGLIIAQAHIHMHPTDAAYYDVEDGEIVKVHTQSKRRITFHDVVIRVSENFQLEIHIDTDEGNAGLIEQGDLAYIEKI